jgi:Domain of unknown function (DUF4157)
MTDRLFRGDDVGHSRGRADDFDPVAEGAQYRLTPEVSLAIWEQVRREATNHDGQCAEDLARARFMELAQRIAERGGQLGPSPFKWTQVDVASGAAPAGIRLGEPVPGKTTQMLARGSGRARSGLPRVPGRTTLVASLGYSDTCTPQDSRGFLRRYVSGGRAALAKLGKAIETRDHHAARLATIAVQDELRFARQHLANGLADDDHLRRELAALEAAAEAVLAKLPHMRRAAVDPGGASWELSGAESAEWRAAIGTPAEPIAADGLAGASEPLPPADRIQRLFGTHLLAKQPNLSRAAVASAAASHAAGVTTSGDNAAGPGALARDRAAGPDHAPLDARLQATFGMRARDVAIERESPRPQGAEGVAVDRRVYLGRGRFDLDSHEGRVRLGHEVAHAVQQQQGEADRRRISTRQRAELETEAELAGQAFARGAPFPVRGRAPAGVALFRGAEPPLLEPLAPPDSEILDTAEEPAPHVEVAKAEPAHPETAPGHADDPQATSYAATGAAGASGAPPKAHDASATDPTKSASSDHPPSTASATPTSIGATSTSPGAGPNTAGSAENKAHTNPSDGYVSSTAGPVGRAHATSPSPTSEPNERHAQPEGTTTVVSVGVVVDAPSQPVPMRALALGAISLQVQQAAAHHRGLAAPPKRGPASLVSSVEPAVPGAEVDPAERSAAPATADQPPALTPRVPAEAPGVRFAPADAAEPAQAADAGARTDASVVASRQRVLALRNYVEQASRDLAPRLAAANQAIDDAKRKSQAVVRGAMAAVREQATTQARSARAEIVQQRDRTVAAIRAAGVVAQTRVDAQTVAALQAVAAAETRCVPVLDAAYIAADSRFRLSGIAVGTEAIAIGASYRRTWMSQLDGKSSVLRGPVHDNRLKARATAADQVAQAYRTELIASAAKQADAAREGKARDREAIAACSLAHRNAIVAAQRDAHAGLAHAEASACAAADRQRATDLQLLAGQERSTRKQIARKESALLQEVGKYASGHQQALRAFVHAAIARCQTGIDALVGEFDASSTALRAEAATMAAPGIDELEPGLQQQNSAVSQAAAATEGKFRGVFAGAEQQIAATAGDSAHGFAGFAVAAQHTTGRIGASITHTISQFAQRSRTGFTAIEKRHAQSSEATASAVIAGSQHIAAASTTAFAGLVGNLRAGFDHSARALESNLRGALKDMHPQIHKSADEAAKQVQPRWKKVLKVVAMVAVVVVVAVVAGPAVIGAVGAMAGGLGAGAAAATAIGAVVGGAVVGAASGAVLQVSNNVIDGNKWYEGVGAAMTVGAISGVFGAVGGLAAKGLTSLGIRTLVTLGFDGAGSVIGNLATGQPLTFEGIAMGLAIGLGMSAGMGALGKFGGRVGKKVEALQTNAHKAGEAVGARAAGAVKGGASGGSPTVAPGKPGQHAEVEPGKQGQLDEAALAKPGQHIEGSALAKQGRKATVEQAHEALAHLNLSAEHAVTVRNASYKLSDLVDIGEGRLAAVAIVEVDGVATVQVFYRSNSQAGWRLLPATNDGVVVNGRRLPGYDKADAEHTLDLPSPVQAKLSSLAEAGNVRADLRSDTVEGLVNKIVPRNRNNQEYFDYAQSSDFAGKQVKQSKVADPASGQIPPGKQPNFEQQVSQYRSKSAAAGEVDALVYESADGTLEYTVFKDADNHVWIGSVTSKEAKITPLGVPSEAATLPKENLVPLWEYHNQIPGGYRRGVTNPNDPNYGSAWAFLKEQPQIQAWYKATGTPMPDVHTPGSSGAPKIAPHHDEHVGRPGEPHPAGGADAHAVANATPRIAEPARVPKPEPTAGNPDHLRSDSTKDAAPEQSEPPVRSVAAMSEEPLLTEAVDKSKSFAKADAKNEWKKLDFSNDPDAPGAVEHAWRNAFNEEYVRQREAGLDSEAALKVAKKAARLNAAEIAQARGASPLNLETARARARADVASGRAFKSDAGLGPDTAAAKNAYDGGTQGQTAKAMSRHLAGKPLPEIEALLDADAAAGKCTKGPPAETAGKPMSSYTYPDGTSVRLKPRGDAHGDDPMYSVEVTKRPGILAEHQDDVAIKVGADGSPVPKGPDDVQNPYVKGTNPHQARAYEKEVMALGHLKAKQEQPPQ